MTLLTKCMFEFIGTLVLILLGDGVCCATSLNKSKAKGAGWAVVTLGWGLAVMCGVFIAGPYSGAHLNPAVTLGFAVSGKFAWCAVLPYIIAQMLGGFAGAVMVYMFYKDHFDATEDKATKLGVFCTAPAIMNKGRNFFCEAVATWLLVFVILALGTKENVPGLSMDPEVAGISMGDLGAFPVTMLIVAIGMSLGATTGYAINPARDLGPRVAHAVLPIKDKGSNGWGYSWVPGAGPIVGGTLAALTYMLMY